MYVSFVHIIHINVYLWLINSWPRVQLEYADHDPRRVTENLYALTGFRERRFCNQEEANSIMNQRSVFAYM